MAGIVLCGENSQKVKEKSKMSTKMEWWLLRIVFCGKYSGRLYPNFFWQIHRRYGRICVLWGKLWTKKSFLDKFDGMYGGNCVLWEESISRPASLFWPGAEVPIMCISRWYGDLEIIFLLYLMPLFCRCCWCYFYCYFDQGLRCPSGRSADPSIQPNPHIELKTTSYELRSTKDRLRRTKTHHDALRWLFDDWCFIHPR